jgi:aminoglycoside phosphotransferase (APT) family kinase protein
MQRRDLETIGPELANWMSRQIAGDVDIKEMEVPGAGASNETILFTAVWVDEDGEHRDELVLRAAALDNQLFLSPDVFFQWKMMAALAKYTDVPVPSLRWQEPDATILGAPFFIMDRVLGEVPNGYTAPLFAKLSPEQVARLYNNAVAALAQIHHADWRRLSFLARSGRPPGLAGYLSAVDEWYEWARAGRHFDYLERALVWLRENIPRTAPISILWGDSRPGNMIFEPATQQVEAVLDWELADLGTPEADMGWWLMFEKIFTDRMAVPVPRGVPGREEILSAFEPALGRPLQNVHYYDVLAWTRFGITCIRHVDVEQGSPSEAMFKELNDYVIETLQRTLEGQDG